MILNLLFPVLLVATIAYAKSVAENKPLRFLYKRGMERRFVEHMFMLTLLSLVWLFTSGLRRHNGARVLVGIWCAWLVAMCWLLVSSCA